MCLFVGVIRTPPSFGSQISGALVKAVGWYLDSAFLSGDGQGKPLGVINSPSRINVARDGATSVAFADIYNMYSRLHPQCHKEAVWLVNYDVLPKLMTMQDGSSALIWQPVHAYGISGQMPMTIFGKPIIFTEKVPALGITGDISLADLSQYAVGLRQEVILERSNAPGWTRDVESFRCIVRADGQGLWYKPITPANGANTLSWCVTLSSST